MGSGSKHFFQGKGFKILVGALLGILLLVIWLRVIDLEHTLELLRGTRVFFVLLMGAAFIVSQIIRSQRWRMIFSTVGTMKPYEAFRLYMVGVALNFILPIRAGEVAKGLILKQTRNTPISKSMATVVLDRSFDLIPVLFIVLAIPFLPFALGAGLMAMVISVALLLAGIAVGVYVVILLRRRSFSGLDSLTERLPRFIRKYVIGFTKSFAEGMSEIAIQPATMLKAVGMTLLGIIAQTAYYFFLFMSLGYVLPIWVAVIGFILTEMASIFPSPPGQIGSTEVLIGLIFSTTLGVPMGVASAAALIGHPVTAVIVMSIGLFYMNSLGLSFASALAINFDKTKPASGQV